MYVCVCVFMCFMSLPCAESPSSTYASSGSSRELLVLNFDLEVDSVDVELRATLQWMAASELGAPTLHFRRSQQHNIHKVQHRGLGLCRLHLVRQSSLLPSNTTSTRYSTGP